MGCRCHSYVFVKSQLANTGDLKDSEHRDISNGCFVRIPRRQQSCYLLRCRLLIDSLNAGCVCDGVINKTLHNSPNLVSSWLKRRRVAPLPDEVSAPIVVCKQGKALFQICLFSRKDWIQPSRTFVPVITIACLWFPPLHIPPPNPFTVACGHLTLWSWGRQGVWRHIEPQGDDPNQMWHVGLGGLLQVSVCALQPVPFFSQQEAAWRRGREGGSSSPTTASIILNTQP